MVTGTFATGSFIDTSRLVVPVLVAVVASSRPGNFLEFACKRDLASNLDQPMLYHTTCLLCIGQEDCHRPSWFTAFGHPKCLYDSGHTIFYAKSLGKTVLDCISIFLDYCRLDCIIDLNWVPVLPSSSCSFEYLIDLSIIGPE